uniref:ANTH domain-containing protein n=1 Tax=Strongyloides venezuelensis TaxID=75913 RepID=A0A0K0FAH3_STRVS
MSEVNGGPDNEKSIIRKRLYNANAALKIIADDSKDAELKEEITLHVRDYFGFVSTYGVTIFKWEIVKPSVLYMIEYLYREVLKRNLAHLATETERAMLQKDDKIKELKDYIVEKIKNFEEAPFTIQRLSEIIYKAEMYNFIYPLLNAITKIVSVITTQTPLGVRITGVNEEEVVDENISLPTPTLHLKVDELDDDIMITKRPNIGGIENCFISSETIIAEVEEIKNIDTSEEK